MKIAIFSIVLSLVFLLSGVAKLAGLAFEIAAFERWGYPLWFMYTIGALEVAGAIGLLIRRTSALAGSSLGLMMIGAVATHFRHAEFGMLVVAIIFSALSIIRAWIGRDEIMTIFKAR